MSEAGSVAIAGGGIIGLSAAWRLAQRGLQVTVFDQGTMGGEASWASAGMLAVGGEIEEAGELADWAKASRKLYPAFIRELVESSGFAVDFQERGALDLAYSGEEWTQLERRVGKQTGLGILSEPVTVGQVAAEWPEVRAEGLVGARFYPGDGLVNAREATTALCAVCRKLEVRFVQHSGIRAVREVSHGVEVEVEGGSESYSAALIAAGAWSSSIAVQPIPLPAASPVKGHLIGYQQPAQTCRTILRRGHSYLLQRANGLLIAGASVEHAGFNRQVDAGMVARLAEEAALILPGLKNVAPTESWIGFRPASDTLRMGRWGTGGVYLAYGHYRNGVLLAPVTADKLASEISANLGRR